MTTKEFLRLLREYRADHPTQRLGQAAFNLAAQHPDLSDAAEAARGSGLDPFYRNGRTAEFVDYVVREASKP